MKNTMKKSLSIVLSTAFIAAMSASPVVNAEVNPFGMQNLESGYMQLAEGKCGEGKMKKEGKCGEGKCGGKKAKGADGEAKCGGDKKTDHSCGGDKKAAAGGDKKTDGSCGEGKCGGKK